MTHDELIEESFANIIKLSNKLNEYDSKYLIKNVSMIANYINSFENKLSKISSKNNNIPEFKYSDFLTFFMTICALHGYYDNEIAGDRFQEFLFWFYENAINNKAYRPDRITKEIVMAFFDSYKLFKFTYDREPETYKELRTFLFTWEEEINERIQKEIEKLTPGL